MNAEETVVETLVKNFQLAPERARAQRARRIQAHVPLEQLTEVFNYCVRSMGFEILCAITGLDNGDCLGAIYHIAREDGTVLSLKVDVPREHPLLQSVTPIFPAAMAYEKEIVDLFGIQIEGLPTGTRYPLADDWPAGQYPLRKDWTVEMLDKKEASPDV